MVLLVTEQPSYDSSEHFVLKKTSINSRLLLYKSQKSNGDIQQIWEEGGLSRHNVVESAGAGLFLFSRNRNFRVAPATLRKGKY